MYLASLSQDLTAAQEDQYNKIQNLLSQAQVWNIPFNDLLQTLHGRVVASGHTLPNPYGIDQRGMDIRIAIYYGLPADDLLNILQQRLGGAFTLPIVVTPSPNPLTTLSADQEHTYEHYQALTSQAMTLGIGFNDVSQELHRRVVASGASPPDPYGLDQWGYDLLVAVYKGLSVSDLFDAISQRIGLALAPPPARTPPPAPVATPPPAPAPYQAPPVTTPPSGTIPSGTPPSSITTSETSFLSGSWMGVPIWMLVAGGGILMLLLLKK